MNIASTVIPSSTGSVNATAGVGLSGLQGDDFLKVLVKQLQFQDPFKPMGNEEMINQIANIRELEMNTRLSQRMEQLTDQQRLGSAAALIGKYAKGEVNDEQGNVFNLEGVITGIRFTAKGEVMLELDTGQALPLASVTQVTADPHAVTASM